MAAASCPPNYDWAKNSQGMDPCAVASKLIQVCDYGKGIPPLQPLSLQASYPPPTSEGQNSCTCSGPVYALVSACANCQGGTFDSWHDWSHKCSPPFPTLRRPHPNVTIPTWALSFNIYTEFKYDPTSAQALASSDQPQSTSTTASAAALTLAALTTSAASSSSTTDTTASVSSFSASPINIPHGDDISTTASQATQATATLAANQATDQASSGSLKKSNKTGAIAGGVVGGVIFLVAIGAFLLWWLRHRQKLRTAPSAAYIAAYGMARPPTSNSFQPGPFDERAGSPLVSHAYSNSRAEKYRDEEKSTSTYSGGPLQQTTDYSNVAREASPGGSRES